MLELQDHADLWVETAALALCYRQSKEWSSHTELRRICYKRQESSLGHCLSRSLFTLFLATHHLMLFCLKAFFALPPPIIPFSSFCLVLSGSLCPLTKSGRGEAINDPVLQLRKQLRGRILDQALTMPIRCKHYCPPSMASCMMRTIRRSSGLIIRRLNSNLNYSYLGMIIVKLPLVSGCFENRWMVLALVKMG